MERQRIYLAILEPEFEIAPEMTNLAYEIAQDLERVDIIAEFMLKVIKKALSDFREDNEKQ